RRALHAAQRAIGGDGPSLHQDAEAAAGDGVAGDGDVLAGLLDVDVAPTVAAEGVVGDASAGGQAEEGHGHAAKLGGRGDASEVVAVDDDVGRGVSLDAAPAGVDVVAHNLDAGEVAGELNHADGIGS